MIFKFMLYYFIKSLIIWFVSTTASIIALSVKHKITRVIYSVFSGKHVLFFIASCWVLKVFQLCDYLSYVL